jgi:hypothetical protein
MSMSLKTPSKALTKPVLTSGVTMKPGIQWRWRKLTLEIHTPNVPACPSTTDSNETSREPQIFSCVTGDVTWSVRRYIKTECLFKEK